MKQYETYELSWKAPEPEGSFVDIDLEGTFRMEGEPPVSVRGFYAGDGIYKMRFLPEKTGVYRYSVRGVVEENGELFSEPCDKDHHGVVRAKGCALYHEDGTLCQTFGTTVYAMLSQNDELIDETMRTLRKAPFNKIRLCVFPKHYEYNHNDPPYYAFQKTEDGEWDPAHPNFIFWDRFEKRLKQLFEMGMQVDLILFHPYDSWGFSSMSREKDLTYLDYLMRRFAAYPNMWWSLANEYDLFAAKSMEDWYVLESFVAGQDPYHHMLSNHQCVIPWDYSRGNITHVSIQTSEVNRTAELRDRFHKPVLIDECCYEGNLPQSWGAISGQEMTARFWRTFTFGGYCTHGETFLDPENEIVFWAKGGKLRGTSPQRIGFLRQIAEELPGPVEPLRTGVALFLDRPEEEIRKMLPVVPADMKPFIRNIMHLPPDERQRWIYTQMEYAGHCKDEVFLWYYDIHCYAETTIELPENREYRIELIDTWEMTRSVMKEHAHGKVKLKLPGKEYMAVLAVACGAS